MNALKRIMFWINNLWSNKEDIDKAIKGFTKATDDLKRIKDNMEEQSKQHDYEINRLEKEKIVKQKKAEQAGNMIGGINKLLNNKF